MAEIFYWVTAEGGNAEARGLFLLAVIYFLFEGIERVADAIKRD